MIYVYNALGIITRDSEYPNRNLEESKQYYYTSLKEIERLPLLSKTNRYTAWAHYGLSYIFAEQRNEAQAQYHYQNFIDNINILFKEWPSSYQQDKIRLEEHIQRFITNQHTENENNNANSASRSDHTIVIRILLIENEKNSAQYLKKGFYENRITVDIVDSENDGLYRVLNYTYALIIIDISSPHIDGWSIIKKIRKTNKLIPIVVISSNEAINGKIEALELCADDYLLKPYVFSELLARVNNVLRRTNGTHQSSILKIADLQINLKEYKVFRDKKLIKLTKREFLLLTLLAKHKGELLSRTFITEQIWDMNYDSDTNFVDVMIRRLRQKIDDLFTNKLIHSVRGVGYVLEER